MTSKGNLKIFSGKDICAVIPTAGKRMEALSRAVTSVLEQSEMCGEIIVVWDSPSNPPDDLRRGGKVRVIHNRVGSKGVAGARNSAILATDSAFIALLDDDDYWLPKKISEYVKAINSSAVIGFYISRGKYIDTSGRKLGIFPSKKYRQGVSLTSFLNDNIRMLRRRITIPTSSYLFPREGNRGINLFDEEIFLAEDQLLLLKLDQYLPFYLVGDEPLSVTTIYKNTEEGLSKRSITFDDWIKLYNTYFSFLSPRQRDNAIIFFGIRHYRQSHTAKETISWFLKKTKSSADSTTILSSFLWFIINEFRSFFKLEFLNRFK